MSGNLAVARLHGAIFHSSWWLAATGCEFEILICCEGQGETVGSLFPLGLPAVNGRIATARELFWFLAGATPSALVIAKSVFGRVGLFDLRFPVFGQDPHWMIRAIRQGTHCFRLDRRLVLYRIYGANLTTSTDRLFGAWLEIYADTLRTHPRDLQIELYARRFARRYLPVLLAAYPAQHARALLSRAISK